MKIKSVLLILSAIIFLSGNNFAQNPTPETAAKNFYKWYLNNLNKERYPREQEKSKMLKAVSARLGKWLYSKAYENYGADYFLYAQDFDKNWENNIRTSKAVVKGNTATLKVTLVSPRNSGGGFGNHVLAVKLVKESGEWKIDRVSGANN